MSAPEAMFWFATMTTVWCGLAWAAGTIIERRIGRITERDDHET